MVVSLDHRRVEGERRVVDGTAGTADLHRGIRALALDTIGGGDVRAADLLLLRVRAEQLDVTLLSPGGGPGVADQPVLAVLVLLVKDGMNKLSLW